jgi:hypothetical protein
MRANEGTRGSPADRSKRRLSRPALLHESFAQQIPPGDLLQDGSRLGTKKRFRFAIGSAFCRRLLSPV